MDPVLQHEEHIMNFGAFGYEPEQMALVLGIPVSQIVEWQQNSNSFKHFYQRGRMMAQYLTDKKLFELARSGDLKALELFRYELKKSKK